MIKLLRINILLLLIITFSGCGFFSSDKDAAEKPTPKNEPKTELGDGNSFVITNANFFDGKAFSKNAVIVVEDGLIASINPEHILEALPVIDASGQTILPGLIDAHVHAFDIGGLQDALRFGVTTELDMFTALQFAATQRALRDDLARKDTADLFSAVTMVTSKGGHGTQYGLPIPVIASPEEASDFVAARLAEGSDYIKIVYQPGDGGTFTSISLDTLKAVVTATHQQGAMAVVHVMTLEGAQGAVEAGADGLVHIFGDAPIPPKLVAEMRQGNIFVIPTLAVIASVLGERDSETLQADPALSPFISTAQKENLDASFGASDELRQRFDFATAKANVLALHKAGVLVLAGTDAPNPGTAYGVSLHGELAFLVDAGLTPTEALQAATANPATAFALKGRGRIIKRARADLVFVKGDPSKGILTTRSITRIFKNGYEIERTQPVTEKTAAAKPDLANGLVSDFETDLATGFGVPWFQTTDQLANGTSTVALSHTETGTMLVTGEVTTKFMFPWSGAGVFFSENFDKAYDLSDYKTIKFRTKGDARKISVMFFTRTSMRRPAVATFKMTEDWSDQAINLETIRGAAMDEVYGFAITAGRPKGEFEFELDDVVFE